MKYLIIITFLFSNFSAHTQTLKGTVIDSLTNAKLAYVNISVKGKNIGTYSNEKGKYSIDFSQSSKNDTLVVSLIGYKKLKIAVLQFLNSDNNTLNFKMRTIHEALDEVFIKSEAIKYNKNTIKLKTGNRKQTFPTSSTYGSETAILIENSKEKRGKLTSLQLKFKTINDKDFKTYQTYYRLAFYAVNDLGFPSDPIYYEDIIIKPEKDQKNFKIDLEGLDIPFLDKGIFVGIETIKPDKVKIEGSMYLTTPSILYTHTTQKIKYSRSRSIDWVKHSKKSVFKKRLFAIPFIKVEVKYEAD
ncbi:carboxypeptidase-like regulatory domain-containing protein [uncultured Winogradskyella sp.]|uniref:carboxypeptidase-like regulatory domain-containing protein n=1 Tax=Winogradskyella sp. 4-2091 TaxID=3381659 RepID=UPI002606F76B|nr:carboxypeptidase-like regulatory domain-containing protein [uncultured Winogradskyella sp.]